MEGTWSEDQWVMINDSNTGQSAVACKTSYAWLQSKDPEFYLSLGTRKRWIYITVLILLLILFLYVAHWLITSPQGTLCLKHTFSSIMLIFIFIVIQVILWIVF